MGHSISKLSSRTPTQMSQEVRYRFRGDTLVGVRDQFELSSGKPSASKASAFQPKASPLQQAIALVSTNGMALKSLKSSFKKNEEVVFAAVRNNGLALQYAHKSLRGDMAIALAALAQNGHATQFLEPPARRSYETRLIAALNAGVWPKHKSYESDVVTAVFRGDISGLLEFLSGEIGGERHSCLDDESFVKLMAVQPRFSEDLLPKSFKENENFMRWVREAKLQASK